MAAPFGNQYALGNNGGRPPIYSDPNEVLQKVGDYFIWIQGEFEERKETYEDQETGEQKQRTVRTWIRHGEPCTITGLALFLGFADRSTLYEYEKKEEFSYIIKRAMTLVEQEYEFRLHGDKPVGAIFALKNMGWKDRSEVAPVDPDGNALKQQLTITIIRDTASSIAPGDFTPQPATGIKPGEAV